MGRFTSGFDEASKKALIVLGKGSVDEEDLDSAIEELEKQVRFWVKRSNGLLNYDDAESVAFVSFMEALVSYKKDRNAGFKHYSKLRIRWSLIDALRSHGTNVSSRSVEFLNESEYAGIFDGHQEHAKMLDYAEKAFDALPPRNQLIVERMLKGDLRKDICDKFNLSDRQLNRIYKSYVDSIDK